MKRTSIEIHDFYCLNCGKRSMSLPRKVCHQHEQFHRKNLYCPNCKVTSNNIEVKNEIEKALFLKQYKEGVFDEERNKIIHDGGVPSFW